MLNICMGFKNWFEERQFGKSLPETGYTEKFVVIYRAMQQGTPVLKNGDYVTRSRKFATDHARHQVAVEEEDQMVVRATVEAKDVYEAYNPGEYFYGGQPIPGRAVLTINA